MIDPLVPLDLGPVAEILLKKPLILHGADFDLRILKKTFGIVPSDIFDTMIAAQFLGYEKQGLSDLALKHCDVHLPKSAQKADWSERPLDEKLLLYAANDTHYLKTIADVMKEELIALKRLEWHRQTCQKLVRTIGLIKENSNDRQSSWQVKGSKVLKGAALTILKELWSWRESEAQRRDKPSFKIMNSEILVDMAKWSSENLGMDIALMPKAPRHVKQEYRDVLNRIIDDAKRMPLPKITNKQGFNRSKSWTEASKKCFDLLKEMREKMASELKLQPSLLATNAALEFISLAAPKDQQALKSLDCLMPWQIELMGEDFLKVTAD